MNPSIRHINNYRQLTRLPPSDLTMCRVVLIIYIIACSFFNIYAQETRRTWSALTVWNNYEFNANISGQELLYAQAGLRFGTISNNYSTQGILSKLYRSHLLLGYEKSTVHWSYGLNAKPTFYPDYADVYTRPYAIHIGNLADNLEFSQCFSVEYLVRGKHPNANIVRNDLGRLSLTFGLLKRIETDKLFLEFIFSSRFIFINEFGQADDIYAQRFVDKSRLRLQVNWGITDRIIVSAFGMKDTDYFLISATSPEENLNSSVPVLGLGLIVIKPCKDDQESRKYRYLMQ